MNILKSIYSVLFDEGVSNYLKRKKRDSFLTGKKAFEINYNNRKTKFFLNKKFGYVDNYIYDHGIYEKQIVEKIYKQLTKDKIILDIGANIGQHSLLLAPYCKEIYAFEPIPEIFNAFKKSIVANKYNNIFLYNNAIGKEKCLKKINFFFGNAGASSLIEYPEKYKTELIDIKVDTLKNILPKNLKFDIVKIDVEGYEAVVVLDNKEIILKNRPILFMEFAPKRIAAEGTHSPSELINFFLNNDYEIFSDKQKKWVTTFEKELQENANLILKPKEQNIL